MARTLSFKYKGKSFDCGLEKIDRSKLYGIIDIETRDVDGGVCSLATLASDGKTLVPYGGTASGYVNPDGDWISRKDIVAVDSDGKPLKTVGSSFDRPIELSERVDTEVFLDHSIRLCYALHTDKATGHSIDPGFLKALKGSAIFSLSFSYRGGVDPDPAFILQGADKTVWLLIAAKNQVEFVGLEQAAVCAASETVDDDEEEQDDALDFGML